VEACRARHLVSIEKTRTPNLSAGVVLVRRAQDGWRFLLLRCYRNWDFPKGLVEAGEAPLDAARREVTEETLIDDLRFAWGEVHMETGPYSRNKVARYYLAETATEPVTLPVRPELGRPEHHEAKWATLEEAFTLASPRVEPVLKWAASVIEGPGKS
jgi:8-oxo-dGTP pyrophosphatase MutT (NUDIX family)